MSTTQSSTTPGVPTDKQKGFVDGLRELADLLEAHPGVVTDYEYHRHLVAVGTRDELVDTVRALGGDWRKDASGDYFQMTRDLCGGVSVMVYAARERVCEKVVTTETVTREEPDPELLAKVPTVTVTEEVERVEWICPPSLLAPEPPRLSDGLVEGALDLAGRDADPAVTDAEDEAWTERPDA